MSGIVVVLMNQQTLNFRGHYRHNYTIEVTLLFRITVSTKLKSGQIMVGNISSLFLVLLRRLGSSSKFFINCGTVGW